MLDKGFYICRGRITRIIKSFFNGGATSMQAFQGRAIGMVFIAIGFDYYFNLELYFVASIAWHLNHLL